MPFSREQLDELNLLARFSLDTSREGIKVHSDAEPTLIQATQRLHTKGLITQDDGGYLTFAGQSACEHVHKLLGLLEAQ